MIEHPRTAILYYAWDLLKDALDVGGRVYLHRSNNLDVYELPAVCMFFTGESVSPFSGSVQIPDEYLRSASINVDVFAENPNDPEKVFRVEELLNSLARQAEFAFFNDVFFSKRLSTNTNSLSDPGLLSGISLTAVEPFEMETTERILACQRLTFDLSYLDPIFDEKKAAIFDSYLVEIRKVGWDGDTVDPVLIAAEGEFE